jgi:hypothetical protein
MTQSAGSAVVLAVQGAEGLASARAHRKLTALHLVGVERAAAGQVVGEEVGHVWGVDGTSRCW